MKIKDLYGEKLLILDNFEIKVCENGEFVKYENDSEYFYNKERKLIGYRHRFNNGRDAIFPNGFLVHKTKDNELCGINILEDLSKQSNVKYIPKSVINQGKKEFESLPLNQ